MQSAVERATTLIREKYSESLTLNDIADAAIMSRFHFSRIFRLACGISPGRFLTAVRIHEAKRLLLTTQHSIADISCLVGYTSLGTFTTRFTECVGVSPGRFRRLAELGMLGPIEAATPRAGRPSGALTGSVRAAHGTPVGPIFIGVFDRRIPQGKPEACLTVPCVGDWLMDAVPEGDWHVMAVARGHGSTPQPEQAGIERPMLIAAHGPVHVTRGGLSTVDLELHPPRPTSPPVLLTLPSLLTLPAGEEHELRADAAV